MFSSIAEIIKLLSDERATDYKRIQLPDDTELIDPYTIYIDCFRIPNTFGFTYTWRMQFAIDHYNKCVYWQS